MSSKTPASRNLWALSVLCLLRERPMHPYEMQGVLRQWHKEDLLALKRGSLYHAIERLQRAGLIEAAETSREGKRPERTVYRLTETGEDELLLWLRELLAKPVREPSDFIAALSYIAQLSPEDVAEQLQDRIVMLEAEIAALGSVLQNMIPKIGRVVLLEVEYARAMRQAELDWVRSLTDDIVERRLNWPAEERASQAQGNQRTLSAPTTFENP